MARTCEACGKKITVISDTPLELDDEHIICYKCAKPISKLLNDLYYLKSKDEFDQSKDEILKICFKSYSNTLVEKIEEKISTIYKSTTIGSEEYKKTIDDYINNCLITTGYDFHGYKISKYIGIVSGQVVLGTGLLAEFDASVSDFFGEESDGFVQKIEVAKKSAIRKMLIKNYETGGNAIIGVDFDYVTFRNNMIGVIVNGTSVIIEKNNA